ncbi:MAG: PAS domain S-box protein, partial [Armatimonadota bacterium]|nr:PAS domain S-box protein [Armatimonadota bacterium]
MTAPTLRIFSPRRAYSLSPLLVALMTWGLLLVQSFIAHIETTTVIRPFGIGFLLVVALLTILGGRGPGLVTLALSCLSLIFVLTPLGTHDIFRRPRDWTELFFLLSIGGVLVRGLEALHKNELLLAESEEARSRLRAVMDTAPVGVLLSDTSGKLVYANCEAERIWGHPLEAVGREEWSRYRLLDSDGTPTPPERTGLARALAGEAAIIEDERIIVHPDGTRVFVQASSTLVRDDHDRVRSGLVVFSDITERKRDEQEIQRLLAREQLLSRIAQTSLQTLDPELVHRAARDGLTRLLNVDRCFFILDEPDESRYAPGQAIVVNDTQDAAVPEAQRGMFTGSGLRAAITMPLFSGGHLVKTLTVGMTETPRAWTPEEVALVEAVAVQTRAAAEAARSQQRERAIALALQDALIPAVPKRMPGLEMSFYYKAALEEANVGGDFLDVFALQNGQVVFAVGDLSGKGLAAAAQVATVRNMLRYSLY